MREKFLDFVIDAIVRSQRDIEASALSHLLCSLAHRTVQSYCLDCAQIKRKLFTSPRRPTGSLALKTTVYLTQ